MNMELPEFQVIRYQSCFVFRYLSEQWTDQQEKDGFLRAYEMAKHNHRGLVIPFDAKSLTGKEDERWTLLRHDFLTRPECFAERLPLHIRKSSELPFVYISRRPNTEYTDPADDDSMIEAIARSGHFDWIQMHERKGAMDSERQLDPSALIPTVSVVM